MLCLLPVGRRRVAPRVRVSMDVNRGSLFATSEAIQTALRCKTVAEQGESAHPSSQELSPSELTRMLLPQALGPEAKPGVHRGVKNTHSELTTTPSP
jgi:hypothetical protein